MEGKRGYPCLRCNGHISRKLVIQELRMGGHRLNGQRDAWGLMVKTRKSRMKDRRSHAKQIGGTGELKKAGDVSRWLLGIFSRLIIGISDTRKIRERERQRPR